MKRRSLLIGGLVALLGVPHIPVQPPKKIISGSTSLGLLSADEYAFLGTEDFTIEGFVKKSPFDGHMQDFRITRGVARVLVPMSVGEWMHVTYQRRDGVEGVYVQAEPVQPNHEAIHRLLEATMPEVAHLPRPHPFDRNMIVNAVNIDMNRPGITNMKGWKA